MAFIYGAGGKDGTTQDKAAPSALSILKTNPYSANGLYWIKNNLINSGTPFQVYCDMATDGGGWMLIVCNSNINGSTKLNHTNYNLYNQSSPTITQSYSILGWADKLKGNNKKFQYMLDAGVRGQLGGIWTANKPYSFVSNSNNNTDIMLNTKFGNWSYADEGLEARMPWVDALSTDAGKLTTSASSSSNWWGTIIEASSSFSPAPWMGDVSPGNQFVGNAANPDIIWYWVRPL